MEFIETDQAVFLGDPFGYFVQRVFHAAQFVQLHEVAKRIAKKYRLICFDEFHVSDVADAMILYNLMKALYDNGVSFIMTSNYEPSTLYPDGLHRDRILPTIALLKEKMDVLNVDAGVDYRGHALAQSDFHSCARRGQAHALAGLILIHDVYRRDWQLWLEAAGATEVDATRGPIFKIGRAHV